MELGYDHKYARLKFVCDIAPETIFDTLNIFASQIVVVNVVVVVNAAKSEKVFFCRITKDLQCDQIKIAKCL